MRKEDGMEAAQIADKGRKTLLAPPSGKVASTVAAEGIVVHLCADAAAVGNPPVAVRVVDGDHKTREALRLVQIRDSADAEDDVAGGRGGKADNAPHE